MPPEEDLQRQIDRLAIQVDRIAQAMDGAYLRKDVFVAEIATVKSDNARLEESMKWMRRSLILAVVGMVGSVVGAFLISRLIGA